MNRKMSILKNLAWAAGAALVVKGLDNRLETIHYTICSDRLPKAFDSFKIVQLSDYHNDTVPGLLEAVRAAAPDIICTTGDMADDEGSYMPAVHLFRQLSAIAPTFAISGNHEVWRGDYKEFVTEVRSSGAVMLCDETADIECDGEKITLSGIGDPLTRIGSKMSLRLERSLEKLNIDNSMFNILLFHRANMLDHLRDRGFDLILSGHMHGGQFRLPTGQGIVSPKSSLGSNSPILFPKYFGGRYEHKDTVMLVNRGLGNPMVIPRLFNRPEITVITLKNEI